MHLQLGANQICIISMISDTQAAWWKTSSTWARTTTLALPRTRGFAPMQLWRRRRSMAPASAAPAARSVSSSLLNATREELCFQTSWRRSTILPWQRPFAFLESSRLSYFLAFQTPEKEAAGHLLFFFFPLLEHLKITLHILRDLSQFPHQ